MFKGPVAKLPSILWLVLAILFVLAFINLAVSLNIFGSVIALEEGVIYDYNQIR